MLSPSGPSGMVAGSGGVQFLVESVASCALCDAKLLVRPEKRMASAVNTSSTKPQRAILARVTDCSFVQLQKRLFVAPASGEHVCCTNDIGLKADATAKPPYNRNVP